MRKSKPGAGKILLHKYVFKSWSSVLSLFVQVLGLIILYLFFETRIERILNIYWVKGMVSEVSPGSLNWICTLITIIATIYITYQITSRNFTLRAIEIFLLLFYVYYRFIDLEWIFYPYDFLIKFFDIIPVIVILSKSISIVYFYLELNKSGSKPNVIDPDLPLDDSNPKDELRRTKFANELVAVLKQTRPSTRALVIGINGAWGSGKSSLQYLIKKELNQGKGNDLFYKIEFNPWFYSKDKSLAHSFLNTIKQAIRKDQYVISSTINRYATTLLHNAENILLKTQFLKDFGREPSIEDELETVKSNINDLRKTLIVIIDDLDRLSSEELVEVFRLVRLVADFPNTIYIILYDKKHVTSAIQNIHHGDNANTYIDKIVQVEYTIPESNVENTRQLFLKYLSNAIVQGVPESKRLWSEEQINVLIKHGIFSDSIKHIRDIKRFSNNFLLRYKSIHDNVNFNQFLLLELLRYKYPDFVSLLFSEKRLFITEMKEQGQFVAVGIPVAETPFWNALRANPKLGDVLRKMAEFKNEEHSISEPFNFAHYFTLTLNEDFINDAEFNDAIINLNDDSRAKLKHWRETNPDMLIYKFRNYDIFKELGDFTTYMESLILVSTFIRDEERLDKLPLILVDKYRKLSGNTYDSRHLYELVSKRLFDDNAVSDILKDVFRSNTSLIVTGDYADSPLLHGWSIGEAAPVADFFFSVDEFPKGKFIVFNTVDFSFNYDIAYAPVFLRNVRCEFKLFVDRKAFFYVRVSIRRNNESKVLFIRPSEQPTYNGLGKISDNEYVAPLSVTIMDDWYTFDFNVDQIFRTSDFAMEGYELIAVIGITVRGKLGFGTFELY